MKSNCPKADGKVHKASAKINGASSLSASARRIQRGSATISTDSESGAEYVITGELAARLATVAEALWMNPEELAQLAVKRLIESLESATPKSEQTPSGVQNGLYAAETAMLGYQAVADAVNADFAELLSMCGEGDGAIEDRLQRAIFNFGHLFELTHENAEKKLGQVCEAYRQESGIARGNEAA